MLIFGEKFVNEKDCVWCEQCSEQCATIHLKYASLCDDCFGEYESKEFAEVLGYRPCFTVIWQNNGQPALCLAKWGTEHEHS